MFLVNTLVALPGNIVHAAIDLKAPIHAFYHLKYIASTLIFGAIE